MGSEMCIRDRDFKPHKGAVSTDKEQHAGVFAEHTFRAYQQIYGELTVSRAKHTPGPLELGQYRLTVEVTLHKPSTFTRRSEWLGNQDSTIDETTKKTITMTVNPPTMGSKVNVDFDQVCTSVFKRGSKGGFDAIQLVKEPYFSVKIIKVEII